MRSTVAIIAFAVSLPLFIEAKTILMCTIICGAMCAFAFIADCSDIAEGAVHKGRRVHSGSCECHECAELYPTCCCGYSCHVIVLTIFYAILVYLQYEKP